MLEPEELINCLGLLTLGHF